MNVYTAFVNGLAILLCSGVAAAEEKAAPVLAADPLASSGKVAMFLVLVVGMIFLLAWLVNKTRAGQWAGQTGKLKMLAVLPLGTKEKIAVIQAGDQQLVVGITAHQITTLATLDTPLEVSENQPVSFAEILKMAVQK